MQPFAEVKEQLDYQAKLLIWFAERDWSGFLDQSKQAEADCAKAVRFRERHFYLHEHSEMWRAEGVCTDGHTVWFNEKKTDCSCFAPRESHRYPPCMHKIALAKAVIEYIAKTN